MMYHHHYILDEHNNAIPEPDVLAWARWMEDARPSGRIIIGQKTFTICGHEMLVSTVFLGANHNFSGEGEPILYETMVLGDGEVVAKLADMSEQVESSIFALAFGGVDIQRRYRTRQEAVKGHEQMVQFVEVCAVKLNVAGNEA